MDPFTTSALSSVLLILAKESPELLRRIVLPSAKRAALSSKGESVEQLQVSLSKLEDDIADLKSQKEQNNDEQISNIISDLQQARNQVENLDNIIFPKDLNLRLVRADLLDRLDEYRSDQSVNFLMVGLFGGASSAIVVNWVTSQENAKTDLSITLLCILLALVTFFSFKAHVLAKRAATVKKRMFEEE